MTRQEGALRSVSILGSTGSIGTSTLDVLSRQRDRFRVVGLAAGRNVERLAEQARRFRPEIVSVADEESASSLGRLLEGEPCDIVWGPEGAIRVATSADVVLAAIVGAAGLLPTLAAVRKGCVVALANKEALVVAGELLVDAARQSGASLLPVDSEHNAIHQCLRAGTSGEIRRLVLTASGGPFRGYDAAALERVTVAQALAHPTWQMGPKVTIDSATLMNKGLEVIEASHLFQLGGERIDVVIHPQSIVHGMVEFRDGSVVAQLGTADMRHPIQYALTWPERLDSPVERLDLPRLGRLTFEEPDTVTFPCLALAYDALRAGGDAPARLNAANEIAVGALLEEQLRFADIPAVIRAALDGEPTRPVGQLEDLLDADRRARVLARSAVDRETSRR